MSILTRTLLNENPENGIYELRFQVSDIYNRCALKVSEACRAATFLFHAIDSYPQEEFMPMFIDSIPIIYSDNVEGEKIAKANVRQWVYRNCFTNFLAGAAESLIASRLLLEIQKLAKESNNVIHDKAHLDEKLDKLEVKSRELPIPKLFKEIKNGLGIEILSFEKEILSINSVRNCIVHHDALVLQKYVESGDVGLELHYVDNVAKIQVGDEWILLTKEVKGKQIQTTALGMENVSKMVRFPLGSMIELNPELINAVAYTCNLFADYLLKQFEIETPSTSV